MFPNQEPAASEVRRRRLIIVLVAIITALFVLALVVYLLPEAPQLPEWFVPLQ